MGKLKSGTCRVCACTDVSACDGGCSWVDDAHTLCSSCDPFVDRASPESSIDIENVPVYGLAVIERGPLAEMHWLRDYGLTGYEKPAIFFSKEQALIAAEEERQTGLDVIAVEMKAVSIESEWKPLKRKSTKRSRRK